jgi:molybdate transport system substrate-binding protein
MQRLRAGLNASPRSGADEHAPPHKAERRQGPPDITTPHAFKQALLNARSIAYTDPRAGGSSGIFLAGLFERLGIADIVQKKAVLGKRGHDVARSVAEGRAEAGITFISELISQAGVIVVGPLPGDLYNANTYSAAISVGAIRDVAESLLRKFTDTNSRDRRTAAGLSLLFCRVDG